MIDTAANSFSTLAHDTKDTVNDKLDLVVDVVDHVIDRIKEADLPAPVASAVAALPQRKRKKAPRRILWVVLAAAGLTALVIVMQKKGRAGRYEQDIAPDAFGEAVTETREATGAFA